MPFRLKRTSSSKRTNSDIKLVTKTFDLEDISIGKKFSQCLITYKIKGSGMSQVKAYYRLDNGTWRALYSDTKSQWSINNRLMRTFNIVQTAIFSFPKRTTGKTIAIKLEYFKANDTNGIEGFELSDITFTYRAINRK